MISGERIRQAREIRGMTQAELAEKVSLHQSNIARLEQGIYQPLDTVVQAVALATGFPVPFFREDPIVDFPQGSLLYRKRASLRTGHKSMLRQTSSVLFEIGLRLSREAGEIPMRLPATTGDPERDARNVREVFGYEENQPLINLVRAIEQLGVFVIALTKDIDDHDAFSLWAKSDQVKPVLVLSIAKPGDRLRFSLAHELGHLMLHKGITAGVKVHERQADAFASELLLPTTAMLDEMVPPLNLTRLAELKARWGVSIQALLVRALRLQIITLRQYKYLFQQLTVRGWRKREPVNVPVERPRLLLQLIESVFGIPVMTGRVAELLNIPEVLLEQVLSAYQGKTPISSRHAERRVISFKPTGTKR